MESLVDVNVYLSRWPFRRLPDDDTPELVARLKAHGIEQAWAGSFDALLHRDVGGVNLRLADECRRHGAGRLLPIGAVNPRLPDWEEDVRRCDEEYRMPGLRLHPNYHGYKLDDPAVERLFDIAVERKLIVQIAVTMEDDRTQHPLVQVPHVDCQPLVEHARRRPELRLLLLNAFRSLRVDQLEKLADVPNIAFDVAMLEGLGGISRLAKVVGIKRVLLGSYAPFFALESALLKLDESPLAGFERVAGGGGNARALLKR